MKRHRAQIYSSDPYVEFRFEKSLRKYQKSPSKKIKIEEKSNKDSNKDISYTKKCTESPKISYPLSEFNQNTKEDNSKPQGKMQQLNNQFSEINRQNIEKEEIIENQVNEAIENSFENITFEMKIDLSPKNETKDQKIILIHQNCNQDQQKNEDQYKNVEQQINQDQQKQENLQKSEYQQKMDDQNEKIEQNEEKIQQNSQDIKILDQFKEIEANSVEIHENQSFICKNNENSNLDIVGGRIKLHNISISKRYLQKIVQRESNVNAFILNLIKQRPYLQKTQIQLIIEDLFDKSPQKMQNDP